MLRKLAKFPHKQLIVDMREYHYWDEIFHVHAKKRTPETFNGSARVSVDNV